MKTDEKFNKRLFRDMHNPYEMDRRDFMRRIGGGLVIAISLSDLPLLAGNFSGPAEQPGLNAYLRIAEDGRVTLYTGKIEM